MSLDTPMMKQYMTIKENYKEDLVFYRLGDFYELFFQDAVIAAKVLNITLTKKHNKKVDIPMAGIPFHAAENYISKLVKEGHSVVVCEQMEEAQKGQLVKREVSRVITPSTISEEISTNPFDSIVLASVCKNYDIYGLACLEMSSGEFIIYNFEKQEDLIEEIRKISPAEILVPERQSNDFYLKDFNCVKTLNNDFFNYEESVDILKKRNLINKKYLNKQSCYACITSASSIIKYILYTQKEELSYIKELRSDTELNHLQLDNIAIKNLELLKNTEGETNRTLFSTLNETSTAMGARMLKNWLTYPSIDYEVINKRLNNVEKIIDCNLFEELQEFLDNIPDLERIFTRISLKTAKPRDIAALRDSLKLIPELISILKENELFDNKIKELKDFSYLLNVLNCAIVETPPQLLKDGGVIKDEYDEELDELRVIINNSDERLFDLEEEERKKTGISKLKIGYNKKTGFYLSTPNSQLDKVPNYYIFKQSLKNETRYTIPELNIMEEKKLTANSKALLMEKIIFDNILELICSDIKELSELAIFLAEVDVINSFAWVSEHYNYNKPVLGARSFHIQKGRHPVIEKYIEDDFVENDFDLNNKKLILLTGANMGGKSTYMRQNAIISIMAHIGCFVPAEVAKIKKIDRIFTRIGSGDNLSEGLSTFMVEMKEMANILNNATKDSFVLVDEVGRGTSTYDGLSLAWAFAWELSKCCDTIFSTHYFELTKMEEQFNNIVNMHMKALKFRDTIIFLHKVDFGSVDQSYGLEVAKIAGIEQNVLKNASNKLNELKNNDSINKILFEAILKEVESIKSESLTEKDKISIFNNIQGIVKDHKGAD